MNILVTGGTGFIGAHLVEQLLAAGHSVAVLTTASANHPNLKAVEHQIVWHRGSFGNRVLMDEITANIDVVVHLAWTTVPKDASDNPIFDLESNVVGGLNLLDACVKNSVRRFIFVSTGGAIYGTPQYTPLDERHPLQPISAYGISKATFEHYLRFYCVNRGLHSLSFRISNAYGERQNLTKNQGVIGVWLQKIKNNEPIEIWGDGTVQRDYIYVRDIATALLRGISYSGTETVFNLGSSTGYSLNQILATIAQVIGRSPQARYLPARSFDVPINVLNCDAARRELDWLPLTDLPTGITKVWRWIMHG